MGEKLKIGLIAVLMSLALIAIASAQPVTVTIESSKYSGNNQTFLQGEPVTFKVSSNYTLPYTINITVYEGNTKIWDAGVYKTDTSGYSGWWSFKATWGDNAKSTEVDYEDLTNDTTLNVKTGTNYTVYYVLNGSVPVPVANITFDPMPTIVSVKVDGQDILTTKKATIPAGTHTFWVNFSIPGTYKANAKIDNVKINFTKFDAGTVTLTLKSFNSTLGLYNFSGTASLTKATYNASWQLEFRNMTITYDAVSNATGEKIASYENSTFQLNITPASPAKWVFLEGFKGLDSNDSVVGTNATVFVAVADAYGNVNTTFTGSYTGSMLLDVLEGNVTASIKPDATPTVNASAGKWYATRYVVVSGAPAKVKVSIGGTGKLESAEKVIEYYPGVQYIQLTLNKTSLYANNKDTAKLTAQLKDSAGNDVKVKGVPITISEYTTLGLTFNGSSTLTVNTDDEGKVEVIVKAGNKAGTAKIVASVQSGDFAGTYGSTTLELKQAPDASKILNSTVTKIVAGKPVEVWLKMVDYNGTPIANSADKGFNVEFNITAGDAIWQENNAKVYVTGTNESGYAVATLYTENATNNAITVQIRWKNETGNWDPNVRKPAISVSVVANNVTDAKLYYKLKGGTFVEANNVAVPNVKGTEITIRINLTDAYGNYNTTASGTMIVTTDNPSMGNMTNDTTYYTNNLTVTITNGVGYFKYVINTTEETVAHLTLNVTTFNFTKMFTISTTGPKGILIEFNNTAPVVGQPVKVTAWLTDSEGNKLAKQGVNLSIVVRMPNGNFLEVANDTQATNASGAVTWTLKNATMKGDYRITVSNYTYGISNTAHLWFYGKAKSVSLEFNKTEVYVNDTVLITAYVKDEDGNVTRDLDGKSMKFYINDVLIATKKISDGQANITRTFTTAGSYTITVVYNTTLWDEKTITVTTPVVAKPDLTVESINVTPESPVVNETVTVEAKIVNIGDADAGAFNVSLYVNDALVETKSVESLAAGANTTVEFSWTPEEAKTYVLKVVADVDNAVNESNESNNEMTKEVTVLKPPNVYVKSFSLNVTEGFAPLTVEINATVVNTGDVAGSITVYFYVEGVEVYNETVEVAANATEYVTYVYTFEEAGTYNVTVDELTPVTVEVGLITGSNDCDGDGLYEDVDGSGCPFNFGDVVALFKNFEAWHNAGYDKYYDFNGDGILNFGDVVALFKMLP